MPARPGEDLLSPHRIAPRVFLVGTSGWSYDDWVGPVYPEPLRERKGAWLEYYATRFGAVEVNSSFYRTPNECTVEGWIEKAKRLGGPFEFSLKAPQDVTHTAMVQGDKQMVRDLLDQFTDVALAPLQDAGVLGAALLQLSPHFHGGEGQVQMLDLAVSALAERSIDVAVEFRHRTWLEDRHLNPGAMDLLQAKGAALCAVDGPSFPPMLRHTARHAYVRFHGRRADAWFAKGAARETQDGLPARYDYLYPKDELAPWARILRENEAKFERIRVFFNNHPRGQAVRNAEQMMDLLQVAPPERQPQPAARRDQGQRKLDAF